MTPPLKLTTWLVASVLVVALVAVSLLWIEVKRFTQLPDALSLQSDVQILFSMYALLGIIMVACLSALLPANAFVYLIYQANRQRMVDPVSVATQPSLETQRQINQRLERANVTLQVSEEKLAVTLNSIGDGVIATDAAGLITMINPPAE